MVNRFYWAVMFRDTLEMTSEFIPTLLFLSPPDTSARLNQNERGLWRYGLIPEECIVYLKEIHL